MKTATFGYHTRNLGDDMQAMAASSHLPHIDTLINRDRLNKASLKEPHLCIMSSWFLVKNFKKAPVPELSPIFFGFCLGRDELLDYEWRSYLKNHEPIGCRDQRTVTKLKENGIEAFFTGCITLYMGRQFEKVAKETRKDILIVDVPQHVIEKVVPKHIRENAKILTNYADESILDDPIARMARMANIADKLRTAKLVITSRLHTLLPCVGFETPAVVLVEDDPKTRNRFSGYDDFLPVFYYDKQKIHAPVDWDTISTRKLPDELENNYSNLRNTISERLGNDLPSPQPSIAKSIRFDIPEEIKTTKSSEILIDMGITVSKKKITQQYGKYYCEFDGFSMLSRFSSNVSLSRNWHSRQISLGSLRGLIR